MKSLLKLLAVLTIFATSMACNKDYLELDRSEIENYLTANNIDAQVTEEGVYYVLTEEGIGNHPNINSTVEVRYTGYFLDGEIFDQTMGSETISFPLRNVIEGWQIGIPLLKIGGKVTLYIPSPLGYGGQERLGIPANSILAFDVELVNF